MNIAKILLIFYIFANIFLYLFQNSLIFFPRSTPDENKKKLKIHHILISRDNIDLHGWYIKHKDKNAPLIIYYGGNAEELSSNALDSNQLEAASMLFINYRGYGDSNGKPGEKELCEDALYIFDHMVKQHSVSPENIILLGRSLGSGVATYVARKREVKGVILVTPFDSLQSVAKTHYPIFPVAILLNHHFRSIDYAKEIPHPLLVLLAEHDTIVPRKHSSNLIKHWQGKKRWVEINNSDHNSISTKETYWAEINNFIHTVR